MKAWADRYKGITPEQFLTNLARQFRQAESTAKMERDRAMYLSDMFYRGKHRVSLTRAGWYREDPQRKDAPDFWYPENYFRVLLDGNVTQMVRAQGEFRVRAPIQSRKSAMASKAENAIADNLQRKHFSEPFRHDVAKRVQLHGTVVFYGYWDPNAGQDLEVEIPTPVETPGGTAFQCSNCGMEGSAEELLEASTAAELGIEEGVPGCPECGSTDLSMVEVPGGVNIQMAKSTKKSGDVGLEIIPTYEFNINSGARLMQYGSQSRRGRLRISNFLWAERTRLIDRSVAESLYPDAWEQLSAGSDENEDRQESYQRHIERTSGGAENDRTGASTHVIGRLIKDRQTWFPAEVLKEYVASSRYRLWGENWERTTAPYIEEGQSLADLFPDGVKVCMSAANVVGVYPESFHEHFRFAKIRHIPDTFWGGDFSDAIPLQKLLNEYNSLILTNSMHNDAPLALINTLYVKGIETYGHPGQVLTHQTPAGEPIPPALVERFQGMPLAGPAYQHPDNIRRQMQALFGGSFFNAITAESGSENMRTAMSWNVAQSQAAAKSQTMYNLLADGYASVLEMLLVLFGKHADSKRIIEMQGDYAEVETMALDKTDIGEELEVTVRPGSAVPRLDFQVRDDFMGAMAATEGMTKLTGRAPTAAIANLIATRWDVPTFAAKASQAVRAGERMLRVLRELSEKTDEYLNNFAIMAQSQGIPPDQMNIPTDPTEVANLVLQEVAADPLAPAYLRRIDDLHGQIAEYLQDWLGEDEGLNASPILSAIVQRRIVELWQAQAVYEEAMAMAHVTPMQAEQMAQQEAMQAQQMQMAQGMQQMQMAGAAKELAAPPDNKATSAKK
jgi:hypothetical protein